MERQTVLVLAVALLSVLAIGFAAATVSETVQTGTNTDGGPDGGLIDLDLLEELGGSSGPLGRILIAFLGLAVLGIGVYLFDNRSETYEVVSFLVIPAAVLLIFVLLVATILSGGDISLFGSLFGNGAGGAVETAIPSIALVGVFAVVVLGIVAAVRLGDDAAHSETDTDARQTQPSTEPNRAETLAEIAGQAADRIEATEDSRVENEVYRAWDEMTAQLDARDDAATTPREFARIATDAGLSADDVEELTTLFEDVRYGGYSPTTDREQRAVSVLRRIEEEDR